MRNRTLLAMLILAWAPWAPLAQGAERYLPFQGYLTAPDGAPVPDGLVKIQFRHFNAPVGGAAKWDGETHTVAVSGGLVNVVLGGKAPFGDATIFNQPLYLEITVDVNGDGVINHLDPPMLPRQLIVPVIYAQDAGMLQGRRWGDFFISADGGDPVDQPELARARDAHRLYGIAAEDLLVDPTDKETPKVQRALVADGISGDLVVGGDAMISGDLSVAGETTLKADSAIQVEGADRQFLQVGDGRAGVGMQSDGGTSGTLYFRSENHFGWYQGGVHSDTPLDPGEGGEAVMVLKNGRLGVGVADPTAFLDVAGGADGPSSLRLRSGNTSSGYGSNQMLFSYDGTDMYTHAIKSRHHSGQASGNAIDFFLWNVGQDPGDVGNQHVMSLDGGRVGIGTRTPQADLDIHGSFAIGGRKPIHFQRYNMGLAQTHNTEYSYTEWAAAIVGMKFLDGDINENHAGDIMVAYMSQNGPNQTWRINMNFRTHNTHQKNEVVVMFIDLRMASMANNLD